jgi:hypothetical protein
VIDSNGDSPLVWSGLPFTKYSWSDIGPLPSPSWFRRRSSTLYDRARWVPFDQLACSNCRVVGGLVSREWLAADKGSWPLFGEHCPLCAGELCVLYECINWPELVATATPGGGPMPLPLAAVFEGLSDPRRQTKNKLHGLTDVLTIATFAVIAGAES